jgi:DNA-directed RNA polymerase I subunit RPA43
MAPRAATAYFLFAEEHRAAVRQELLDAAGEGQKVGVADVGKAMGDKWRGLSDEEKERYKQLAQQKTGELRAQAAAEGDEQGEQGDDAQQQQQQQQHGGSTSLPLGTVKKIMMMDKEVSRASADCVRTIALAAEVFLGLLGSKCGAAAQKGKRRTIQLKDFEHAVRYDKRLVEAGLKDVLQEVQEQAEAAAAARQQQPRTSWLAARAGWPGWWGRCVEVATIGSGHEGGRADLPTCQAV